MCADKLSLVGSTCVRKNAIQVRVFFVRTQAASILGEVDLIPHQPEEGVDPKPTLAKVYHWFALCLACEIWAKSAVWPNVCARFTSYAHLHAALWFE